MPWAFVCPSSRGIGLQLTRCLLTCTKLPVVATARTDPEKVRARILDGLDVEHNRLDVVELDVTDESTVVKAAAFCKERFSSTYMHLAYCVPGVLYPERSPAQINYEDAIHTFNINTLGPMLLMKHFSPFLPRKSTTLQTTQALPTAAVFAVMSARVGSITDNSRGGWFSYRGSKAATNQVVKSLDIHLRTISGDKSMAVTLHPGTVQTDLSKEFWGSTPKEKLFTPEFAARRLYEVVKDLSTEQRGKCWDWAGKSIPP